MRGDDAGTSESRAPHTDAPFIVTGEIDIATAPRMEADLNAYCERTRGDVIVDCSQMTFIDSSGLAAFETARRELAAHSRRIALTGVVKHCRRAFEIVGLAELLDDPA